MKKRFLLVLLVLLVVIGALSVSAGAAGDEDWSVGNSIRGYRVVKYLGSDTEVTIPRSHKGFTLSIIAQDAFCDADFVKKVTLGDNIREISYGGFAGATGLETVVLPKSIYVGPDAFSGCTSLKNVNYPYEQATIENNTFKNTALTSFTVMSKVSAIGYKAFAGCTQLTDIWMMDQVSTIDSEAFEGVTATVHYSASRWDPAKLKNYGGKLTWVAEEEYCLVGNPQMPIEYWIGGGRDLVLTINAPAEKIHYVSGPACDLFAIPSYFELGPEQCTVVPGSGNQTQIVIKNAYLDLLKESEVGFSVYITDGYSIHVKVSRTDLPAGVDPLPPQPEQPKVHTYTTTVTPPICNFYGYTTHTCTECGDSYVTDWVEALGHDNGEWHPDTDNPGWESRECARCGQIEDRVIGSTEATQPTEPSTQATEPSVQATEPSVQVTEPSVQATEPSVQPTEPATQATQPTTQATVPATQATVPSVQPTQPSGQPSSGAPTVPDAPTEPKKPGGNDAPTDGLTVPLVILGVLVVSAAGAGAVLLKKRRK